MSLLDGILYEYSLGACWKPSVSLQSTIALSSVLTHIPPSAKKCPWDLCLESCPVLGSQEKAIYVVTSVFIFTKVENTHSFSLSKFGAISQFYTRF